VRRRSCERERVSGWLDPARVALDAAAAPVEFFCRDDDAGWDDDGLGRLLDRCQVNAVHIDVAVIPVELDAPLVKLLRDSAASGLVHLHQHGFRHVDHEHNGRKYEFGPSRSHDQQLADIAEGRALIDDQLQPYVDPIFTPPWNRCTEDTAAALVNLGFRVLSCDKTAESFNRDELVEVPVTVDWFATKKGVALTRDQIGGQIAQQITEASRPVGVMLHHAVTDLDNLALIDELLSLVAAHPMAKSTSIYSSSF
jgi:predicted deacetylase